MTAPDFSDNEINDLFRPLARMGHVGLAVSGGADSVALMHLAARWQAGDPASRPHLTVLSVDHGLRPEAAAEAATVVRWAYGLGLAAAVLRWEGEKPATGVQARARIARYDAMAQYAHAHGLGALVTAHHLDDQAETLVMRFARGSGVDGLSGIAETANWAGIPIVRPLLAAPKARLQAMLVAEGVGWIEDPSNENRRFERVRVRAALSELEKLGVTGAALARSARRMAQARQVLDHAAEMFLASQCEVSPVGYCTLDREALRAAPVETAVRSLARVLGGVGGGAVEIKLARLEALAENLRGADGVRRTLAGCRIIADENGISVTREPGRAGLDELRVNPGDCALWDRRFRVSVSTRADAAVTVRALGQKGLGTLRARCGRAIALPGPVAAGLASFWQGGEVVAVPAIGVMLEGTTGATGCFRSDFVSLGSGGSIIKANPAKPSRPGDHEGMNV